MLSSIPIRKSSIMSAISAQSTSDKLNCIGRGCDGPVPPDLPDESTIVTGTVVLELPGATCGATVIVVGIVVEVVLKIVAMVVAAVVGMVDTVVYAVLVIGGSPPVCWNGPPDGCIVLSSVDVDCVVVDVI